MFQFGAICNLRLMEKYEIGTKMKHTWCCSGLLKSFGSNLMSHMSWKLNLLPASKRIFWTFRRSDLCRLVVLAMLCRYCHVWKSNAVSAVSYPHRCHLRLILAVSLRKMVHRIEYEVYSVYLLCCALQLPYNDIKVFHHLISGYIYSHLYSHHISSRKHALILML